MRNRQTLKTDCGPIAIYNAVKSLDIPCRYEEVLKYCKDYGGFENTGMNSNEVGMVLDSLGVRNEIRVQFSVSQIERILDKNQTLILLYRWYHKGKNGGHFVFIDDHNESQFRMWNGIKSNETPWIDKSTVMEYIRYSHRHHPEAYTQGYIIKGVS